MTCARRETILPVGTLLQLGFTGEMLMVAPASEGIDLFKIAGRTISGWVPSLKTDTVIRQPFCSQLEECLLLWLEYHPLVKSYARGDIGPAFANTYRLPITQHAPFAIGYTFEDKHHHYLPDVAGTLSDGTPFIAEAVQEVWPWGEMAPVSEVTSRLPHQFPVDLVEAAIWKVVADAAAAGHLLVDLEQFTLSRTLPLARLSPDAPVLVPEPLPDTLLSEPDTPSLATV